MCLSLAACASTAAIAHADEPALPTVPNVDLQRYAGTWYEIARLPNRFQKQCVSDTQAEYRVDGSTVRVTNRCRTAQGSLDSIDGRAKVVAGSSNAKLRVTFFWPFYGDYWILSLSEDYSDVLVGAPDRKYAWILAREKRLPKARVDQLMRRAQELGFDTARFVATPHADAPTAHASESSRESEAAVKLGAASEPMKVER